MAQRTLPSIEVALLQTMRDSSAVETFQHALAEVQHAFTRILQEKKKKHGNKREKNVACDLLTARQWVIP